MTWIVQFPKKLAFYPFFHPHLQVSFYYYVRGTLSRNEIVFPPSKKKENSLLFISELRFHSASRLLKRRIHTSLNSSIPYIHRGHGILRTDAECTKSTQVPVYPSKKTRTIVAATAPRYLTMQHHLVSIPQLGLFYFFTPKSLCTLSRKLLSSSSSPAFCYLSLVSVKTWGWICWTKVFIYFLSFFVLGNRRSIHWTPPHHEETECRPPPPNRALLRRQCPQVINKKQII